MEQPYQPELYHLNQIDWQLFGTLTFRSERLSEGTRQKMWFAWLRTVGRRHKVHFKKLIWVLRREHGEIGNRLHFHFLLAGLPEASLGTSLNFELMDLWKEKLKGGFARVVRYEHGRGGVEYLTKEQRTGYATPAEQAYEMAKFGSRHCDLTLSTSLHRVLKRANLPRRRNAKW